MNDTSTAMRAEASARLSSLFLGILARGGVTFEEFEGLAVAEGNALIAAAMGMALELFDGECCGSLPRGQRVHDRRERRLATEVGDARFRCRRVRDEHGNTVVPLADALDLPWGCRVSPRARSFLVEAGAEVSYQRAADLLARNGSRVSAETVMRAVHGAGLMCAAEDWGSARSLFADGVAPDADGAAETVLVEADGTSFRLQGQPGGGPARVEVKALVAYESKAAEGKKTVRVRPVRHGCVGPAPAFWAEGVAAIGSRFDLSKVEKVHLGTDGEGWCKSGGKYFRGIDVEGHLDVFHVDNAVLGCFADARAAWQVIGVALDGDGAAAASLLEAMRDLGLARDTGHTARTIAYLRNNADIIGSEGPSLGTMEAENQHVYGSRMDSVPCAWSAAGADSMARIRSRRASGRPLPSMTRAASASRKRVRRREDRIAAGLYPQGAGKLVESVGKGYLPPHQASVAGMAAEVRFAAGPDSGMIPVAG